MVRKAEKKYLETLASIAIILKTVVFDLRYPEKKVVEQSVQML